ncbi:MAG: transporter related protein [Gemmatimonadetes bacterium]|nr:transporter related protein [Gemmatimonadota bacterium]
MIAFAGVTLRYPGATSAAVDGVTFDAAAGRLTAVVGPNGSGKSTTVRALLGRVPIEHGSITLGGAPLGSLAREAVAARVAVVAQREDLVFPLPVHEYVALGRHPHLGAWGRTGARDTAAVADAMHQAGVTELRDRKVDALSGGEWQRVRIARALAQGAPALVLDEPTAFLDVAHEMAVFELLSTLAHSGHAVLLVSHQLNLVARFADHIVLLHHGRVAAAGTPDDVMRGSVLEPVYEWPLLVTRDPAVGAPTLVPLRSRARVSTRPHDTP